MKQFSIPQSRTDAEEYDRMDTLADVRASFRMPDNTIYLVGHSLGPACKNALKAVNRAASREWANDIVAAWNTANWIDLAIDVGAKIAPLIGAPVGDVIICDSVSVNLFKLTAGALPLAKSHSIIIEEDEFPTDQYIAEGLSGLGRTDLVKARAGEGLSALDKCGGVLIKSAVNFRTAEIVDIEAAEKRARTSGGIIVWDLSHATGVVDLKLAKWGVKLAAGCTYKYLNGGPGSPAFLFADSRTAYQMRSPLSGWMGHSQPFEFSSTYDPAPGAARFAAGTPSILSLSALAGALAAFENIQIKDVARKAKQLGDLCTYRAQELGLEIESPVYANKRGGHVSVKHGNGYAVVQALSARGVKADFRTPNTIRFGLSPLYLSYCDVWDAMDALKDILQKQTWDNPEYHRRSKVT